MKGNGGVVLPWLALICLWSSTAIAEERVVKITDQLETVRVLHGEEWVEIVRSQDVSAQIDPQYARTSRPCPPFCIQPLSIAEGVETIGELELLAFMERQHASGAGAIIDARTPDWYVKGTIPGSINIPYSDLDSALGADLFVVEFSLQQLGVTRSGEQWDFFHAKEVVIWCNGPWCDQSPTAIRALLALGYPAEKIKYYRGGMQMWLLLGFPIVDPVG